MSGHDWMVIHNDHIHNEIYPCEWRIDDHHDFVWMADVETCWTWIVENEWFRFFSGSKTKQKQGWVPTQDILKHRAARRGGSLVPDCPSWCSWCLDIPRSSVLHPEALPMPFLAVDAAYESIYQLGDERDERKMWFPFQWIFHFMKNINANRFSQSGFSEVQFKNWLIDPCPFFAAQKSSKIYSLEKHL